MRQIAMPAALAMAALSAATASTLFLQSGRFTLPCEDGSFGTAAANAEVSGFYCHLTEAQYWQYASNAPAAYAAYCNGGFDNAEWRSPVQHANLGYINYVDDGHPYPGLTTAYFLAVFTYEADKTYYIARALAVLTEEEDYDDTVVPDIAVGAGRWNIAAPLSVACLDFGVTNGAVYALYSISDPARFSEIATGGQTMAAVAADLARTTGATNLAATATLDAAAGTFRLRLDPGGDYRARHSSLFLFGLEKPGGQP